MKVLKKWRYYCDYCKKSGGSKHHMEKHEHVCTMNPGRSCNMCDYTDGLSSGLSEMVSIVKASVKNFIDKHGFETWVIDDETEEGIIEKIRDISDCPACILSALRQSGVPASMFLSFNYKKEREAMWENWNEDQLANIAY